MLKNDMLALTDRKVRQVSGNVNCQSVGDAEALLEYLAPDVFRVATSDKRTVTSMDGR